MRRLFATAAALLCVTLGQAQQPAIPDHPRVRIDTTLGSFVAELDYQRAPITVENFLRYVDEGHYTNTIFHRVINGFVAQGGGYTPDMVEKKTHEPIFNESGNGLQNDRGTVGMARTGKPHTATSQFFINLVDNDTLNPLPSRWGYAVFGRIVEGMDIVDKIAHVPTGPAGEFGSDVPTPMVIIERIVRLDEGPAAEQGS